MGIRMEEEEYSADEMIQAEWEKRIIRQGNIMGISSSYVQMKMVNCTKASLDILSNANI